MLLLTTSSPRCLLWGLPAPSAPFSMGVSQQGPAGRSSWVSCGLLSHGLCAGSATSVTPFQKGSTGTYFPVKLSRPRRLETRATSGTAGAWMPLGVVKPSPREARPASPFLAATCAPPWWCFPAWVFCTFGEMSQELTWCVLFCWMQGVINSS